MRLVRFALVAVLLVQPLAAARAADWQLVLSDRSRRVEIDRGSIFVSDGGTKVSWARVVFGPAAAERAGYAAIHALNRYDCGQRSFVTIKRVYLDAGSRVLREETVRDPTPVVVTRHSVDERMWREVCSPPASAADLRRVADQVATLAATGSNAAAAAARAQPAAPLATATATAAPAGAGVQASILPPLPDLRAAAGKAAPSPSQPASPPASPPAAAAQGVEAPRSAGVQAPQRSEARVARQARPRLATQGPSAARAAAAAAPDWSYDDGPNGPRNWGRLRPEWKLCSSGTRQSPIDLRDGVVVDLAPLRFDYRPSAFRVRDTGKALQVEVFEDMGMEVRGTRYVLERFTLHRPSQDRVGGQAEDMAIYFEHRSAQGGLAILSVPLSATGAASSALQTLWNNLPLDRGRDFLPPLALDPAGFLPANAGHYLYQGSLPTPPCTEDVLWVVMKAALPISPEQLAVFARLYPRSGRPIQPTNGRTILESR